MHNRPPLWIVALTTVLLWTVIGGVATADGSADQVKLSVADSGTVGRRTELVATVTGSEGEPVGGVEVTFATERDFLNTFGTAVIGRAKADEVGVASLWYTPGTAGEIEVVAWVGDPEGAEYVEAREVLVVATGSHLFHPEDAAHLLRGRWDWFVQWTWLVIMPAAAFAAFLGVLGLLWAVGREGGRPEEPRIGVVSRNTLVPIGGAVAVFALAVVLILGIALRPWASTDTGWKTELNLVHQVPDGYARSIPTLVDEEPSLESWRPAPGVDEAAGPYVGYGCASCHSLDGIGGVTGPNLLALNSEEIGENVRFGPSGMPAFDSQTLTDEHVLKISEFLRQVAIENPDAVPTPVPPPPTPTPTPVATVAPTAVPAPVSSAVATPVVTTPPVEIDSEQLEEGRVIYEVTGGKDGCAFCHGLDARGVGLATESAPDVRGATRSMIRTALADTLDMSDIKLSGSQITAVVEYLRYLAAQP
jgi:mono/diheme cytochrome c family protein